jgi:acyl-CoA thioesterase I
LKPLIYKASAALAGLAIWASAGIAQDAGAPRPVDHAVPTAVAPKPKAPKFVTSCDVPRELVRFAAGLPAVSRSLAQGRPIEIIALGSSSTAGSGASSPQASYPARLEAELRRRFPGRDIEVQNFGTGGSLARDMLERIEGTILDLEPTLVIWQTGVNDATQDVGIEVFRGILERGIKLLKTAGIDVILVDQQFYPRSERVSGYREYLRAMRLAAESNGVGHFQRYAIMKHMVRSGQHSPEQLLAPDNFHLNDLSYGCLADLMAEGIEEQLRGDRINSVQAGKR